MNRWLFFSLLVTCFGCAALSKADKSTIEQKWSLSDWPSQWTKYNPTPTTAFLSGAARCADGGWLVAGIQNDEIKSLAVLRSYDEGVSWEQVSFNDTYCPYNYQFSDFVPVSMVSCNGVVFIVGSASANLATADCGRTWSNPNDFEVGSSTYPSCAYTNTSTNNATQEVLLVPGFAAYAYSYDGTEYFTVKMDGSDFYLQSALVSSSSQFAAVVSQATIPSSQFAYFCCLERSLQSLVPCGNFSAFYPQPNTSTFIYFAAGVPYYDAVTDSYFAPVTIQHNNSAVALGVLQTTDLLPADQTTPWKLIWSTFALNGQPFRFTRWGSVLYTEYLPVIVGEKTKYYASSDNGATWSMVSLPAFPIVIDNGNNNDDDDKDSDGALAFQLGHLGMLGFAQYPSKPFTFHQEGLTSPFNSVAAQESTLLIATSSGLIYCQIQAGGAPSTTKALFTDMAADFVSFNKQLDAFILAMYDPVNSSSVLYLTDVSLGQWKQLPSSPTNIGFSTVVYGSNNGTWTALDSPGGDIWFLDKTGTWQPSNTAQIFVHQLCYLSATSTYFALSPFNLMYSDSDTSGQLFDVFPSYVPVNKDCTLACGPEPSGPLSGLYVMCEGSMMLTMNGGKTWQTIALPFGSLAEHTTISFLDALGIVVLSTQVWDSYTYSTTKTIFLSSDGINFKPAPNNITPAVQLTNFFWSAPTLSVLALGTTTNTFYQSAPLQ